MARGLPLAADDNMAEWVAGAACRLPQYRHVNFFPGRGELLEPARAVCQICPVRCACLTYALDHPAGTKWGIWGGTSERERGRLRGRKDRRAKRG